MEIRVLYGYQGRPSRERLIASGEYAADDVRLFGLAEYLVANGHAVVVEEAAEVPPPEPTAKPKQRRRRTAKAKE